MQGVRERDLPCLLCSARSSVAMLSQHHSSNRHSCHSPKCIPHLSPQRIPNHRPQPVPYHSPNRSPKHTPCCNPHHCPICKPHTHNKRPSHTSSWTCSHCSSLTLPHSLNPACNQASSQALKHPFCHICSHKHLPACISWLYTQGQMPSNINSTHVHSQKDMPSSKPVVLSQFSSAHTYAPKA